MAKSRPISDKCAKRRSYNYRRTSVPRSSIVPEKRVKEWRDKKKVRERARGEEYGASGRGAFYTFACVCAAVQRGLERGSLCGSAFTAARTHTAAKHGRARTPTQSKLAPAVTYVHCNKLRCTYVQRALHVTHVLAYATGSLGLSRASSRCWSFLFSLHILFYLFFSLSLSFSFLYIYIYIHTHIHASAYILRFSLSVLCALFFVGQRLCPTLSLKCAHSSIQIYTPKHTRDHEECMRVLATCAMHFLLAGQPSPFMRRARAGPRWNFIPFSAICYDELFGIRPLNKGNRKTAIARSPCAFRKVKMLRRAFL